MIHIKRDALSDYLVLVKKRSLLYLFHSTLDSVLLLPSFSKICERKKQLSWLLNNNNNSSNYYSSNSSKIRYHIRNKIGSSLNDRQSYVLYQSSTFSTAFSTSSFIVCLCRQTKLWKTQPRIRGKVFLASDQATSRNEDDYGSLTEWHTAFS